MNGQDLAQLHRLAQGEGEMRVGKKLMRALLGHVARSQSGHPACPTAQRIAGSACA
ncbi:hypothetical protein ACFSUK_08085 [Sphingobium scionense]|uniref:Uncharacterized protein n=1 Tax=Sphingobium scionense TaxID=1404341 RepID=A0A7W6LS26_9SPHN|nr:hypothetical protein [Sphingobium scionense]MBB4149117.1 hypothetical protein [Sphingobium scionense]